MKRVSLALIALCLLAAAGTAETLDLSALQGAEEAALVSEAPWEYPLPYELDRKSVV